MAQLPIVAARDTARSVSADPDAIQAAVNHTLGLVVKQLTFKKVNGDGDTGVPRALILDGPNEYVTSAPNQFGPHGYTSLVFDEYQMREFLHRPDGVTIQTKLLTAGLSAGTAAS